MLSPQALERATPGYRRGYNDAFCGFPARRATSDFVGPWERKDYEDGYHAAENDKRWNARECEAR